MVITMVEVTFFSNQKSLIEQTRAKLVLDYGTDVQPMILIIDVGISELLIDIKLMTTWPG